MSKGRVINSRLLGQHVNDESSLTLRIEYRTSVVLVVLPMPDDYAALFTQVNMFFNSWTHTGYGIVILHGGWEAGKL